MIFQVRIDKLKLEPVQYSFYDTRERNSCSGSVLLQNLNDVLLVLFCRIDFQQLL